MSACAAYLFDTLSYYELEYDNCHGLLYLWVTLFHNGGHRDHLTLW